MPHVGRIPSTLEKYRHALSAYLEDITQSHSQKGTSSYSFLYFDEKSDESLTFSPKSTKSNCVTPNAIPDTETRINSSYDTVKKQLDLLSSYFSLIHEDLHGDLLLLRTNLNLLPSNTLHIARQNKSSLHTEVKEDEEMIPVDTPHLSDSNYSHSKSQSVSSPSPRGNIVPDDDDEQSDNSLLAMDNILNTKQTQSIQYIVSILQKFIKYNSILVEYIQQNKAKIDSFWIQNNIMNHPQIHKLNLGMRSLYFIQSKPSVFISSRH